MAKSHGAGDSISVMALPIQEPAIPAVIRIEGGAVDWWVPNRSGDDADDYRAGMAVFQKAQDMAHYGTAFGLMCSFIVAMREVQAFELGFLDAFAAACIACTAPCLYDVDHIAEQVNAAAETIEAEACRHGNREAWEDRKSGRSDKIVHELIRFILLKGGASSPAYVHSLSMAACRATLIDH